MGKEAEIQKIAIEIGRAQPDTEGFAVTLARAAYAIAEKYCDRVFVVEADDFEERVMVNKGTFLVKGAPIKSITSVISTLDGREYKVKSFHAEMGLVVLEERITDSAIVRYKGGFDELPADLLIAIRDIGISLWLIDPNLASLRSGDFSFDVSVLSPKIVSILNLYAF